MSENTLVPLAEVERMALTVVQSRMFPGINSKESAVALMLLCQSEGLHPMQALTRYHMIQGRPAMKADAMLAEFMRRGGTVHWKEWTNEACEAVFKSAGCPEGVTVRWTMDDAKRAGVTGNPTWTKYPRQMLKARVASDGVRMADPAVNQGRYTPEEVSDFDPPKAVKADAEVVDSPAVTEAKQIAAEAAKNRAELVAEFAPRKFDDKNAAALVDSGAPAPPVCTAEGCDSPICEFESESKQFQGRRYFMCRWAYEEKHRLVLDDGMTNAKANAKVAGHYRAWAEPWQKKEGAGNSVAETVPQSVTTSSTPAPSFQDQLVKIQESVRQKVAKEADGDAIPF